ncbi:hypothetical protein L3X39_08860 [Sabulilitoribacter multivorans]|uniref:Uncharacterized protein n=1 Tax=Flaviramulus multivorans TaxID=1304750 RepID=A0ABS9IJJ1_9FLAO|nr:hypothetical protein [Flaviramulus multivorans]MCF7560747.1 hypothetical protein [Flaviramulus multivorans]
MKKGIFALIIILLTTSCVDMVKGAMQAAGNELDSAPVTTSESNYVTVGADDLFQVDLPYYMKPVSQLHPDASFQYANIFKEAYFVIIQEDKNEYIDTFKQFGEYDDELPVIENYKNAQKTLFRERLINSKIQEYGLNNINDNPARQLKILGQIEDIKAAYIVTFIEGEKDIFMLMNWTLEDRFKKLENSFEYINSTFQLIEENK